MATAVTNEPDVLACERDARCYGDAEKNAVGRILFNNGGAWYVCTGTLLNDRAQNRLHIFSPRIIAYQLRPSLIPLKYGGFTKRPLVTAAVLRSGIVHSTAHANLLVAQRSNDFALLRLLSSAPGGACFQGGLPLRRRQVLAIFGLHHPGGYVPPSLNSYLRRATGSITSTNYGCAATGLVNGYGINWTAWNSRARIQWIRPVEFKPLSRRRLKLRHCCMLTATILTASLPTFIRKYVPIYLQ